MDWIVSIFASLLPDIIKGVFRWFGARDDRLSIEIDKTSSVIATGGFSFFPCKTRATNNTGYLFENGAVEVREPQGAVVKETDGSLNVPWAGDEAVSAEADLDIAVNPGSDRRFILGVGFPDGRPLKGPVTLRFRGNFHKKIFRGFKKDVSHKL